MTTPLSTGEKARRANIRAMKAIGRANAKARAATAKANVRAHLAAMEERRLLALTVRVMKRDAGVARRNAHNAVLKAAARVANDDRAVAVAVAA